jgi:hypothetical protein
VELNVLADPDIDSFKSDDDCDSSELEDDFDFARQAQYKVGKLFKGKRCLKDTPLAE